MKIVNHHLKAETILKLTFHSQLLQNYFSHAKIYILKMTKLGQGVQSKGTLSQPIKNSSYITSVFSKFPLYFDFRLIFW